MVDVMEKREIIAFGLIVVSLVFLILWTRFALHKRKREKLRRRGIKRYGH